MVWIVVAGESKQTARHATATPTSGRTGLVADCAAGQTNRDIAAQQEPAPATGLFGCAGRGDSKRWPLVFAVLVSVI